MYICMLCSVCVCTRTCVFFYIFTRHEGQVIKDDLYFLYNTHTHTHIHTHKYTRKRTHDDHACTRSKAPLHTLASMRIFGKHFYSRSCAYTFTHVFISIRFFPCMERHRHALASKQATLVGQDEVEEVVTAGCAGTHALGATAKLAGICKRCRKGAHVAMGHVPHSRVHSARACRSARW